jgi:hypothetical protein
MATGRKLLVPNAFVLMERDRRPPVLYLRPFAMDGSYSRNEVLELLAKVSPLSAVSRRLSYEEQLVETAKCVGPVVAVGRPGEELPELGAARMYLPDQIWQSTVRDVMSKARLVILRIGDTPGVIWEFTTALELVSPENLVLYFQPARVLPAHFQDILPSSSAQPIGSSRFVYFDSDWTAHSTRSLRSILKRKSLYRISLRQVVTVCALLMFLTLLAWFIFRELRI